jgi:hypothetical protein
MGQWREPVFLATSHSFLIINLCLHDVILENNKKKKKKKKKKYIQALSVDEELVMLAKRTELKRKNRS